MAEKALGGVLLRLTPYQTRKLRAHFKRVSEANEKGHPGVLGAQIYSPGDFVHGYGLQSKKVAVARVGFLNHENAKLLTLNKRSEGKSESQS